MSRIEDLALAIYAFNGSNRPDDPAYKARNPLRLQTFNNGAATGNLRKFNSFHSGFMAGTFDLKLKCSGKSRAKLDGDDFTLTGLMLVYNLKPETAIYVARFLKQALHDDSIKPETRLDYFCETKPVTMVR
jgi:hypothetical protein